jgi:hypothetical protein
MNRSHIAGRRELSIPFMLCRKTGLLYLAKGRYRLPETAMRVQGLLKLTWDKVDAAQGQPTLPGNISSSQH